MLDNKYINNADTPQKRIGVLLIVISLILILITMVHWNLAKKPFLYQKYESWIVEAKEPANATEGSTWKKESIGWNLYNDECYQALPKGISWFRKMKSALR